MDKSYAPDLRKRRLAAGLSQAEVGKKVGVSQMTISNWEQGKTAPDKKERKALDTLLGARGGDGKTELAHDGANLFGAWLRKARANADMTVPELAEASGVSAVQIYNLEAGRSANPREQTRLRLETALNTQVPQDIAADVAEEQEIVGLGPLTDFDPHDKDDRPTCAGVYVFYDVSDRPVYVGKSKNIKSRVGGHEDKFWFKFPIVSHGAYIEVKDDALRHQVEQVLIKFLKSNAVINKQSVDQD
jgi:transcriptional regulator with XRE-family HTH domain